MMNGSPFVSLAVPGNAYLTGSINTTRPHTNYWYHIGDEIRLECHLRYSEVDRDADRQLYWMHSDKMDGHGYHHKFYSPKNQQTSTLSSTTVYATLQWYYNSSLLKCLYVVEKQNATPKKMTLMTVRLHLNTSSNPEAEYTQISGTINTTALYYAHRYSVGDSLQILCYPQRAPPQLYTSSLEWSTMDFYISNHEAGNALVIPPGLRVSMGGGEHLRSGGSQAHFLFEINKPIDSTTNKYKVVVSPNPKNRDGRDQTTAVLQKESSSLSEPRSILRMTLTQEHDLWILQCTHEKKSRDRNTKNIDQKEILIIRLILEYELNRGFSYTTTSKSVSANDKATQKEAIGNDTIYVIVGSIFAITIISCIILYFVWGQLRQQKNTHYANLELKQRPSKTPPAQEPYAEVMVNNENYISALGDAVNDEAMYANTSEPCYAEINPYARHQFEAAADPNIEHVYATPTRTHKENTASTRAQANSKNAVKSKKINPPPIYENNTLPSDNYQNCSSNGSFYAKCIPKTMRSEEYSTARIRWQPYLVTCASAHPKAPRSPRLPTPYTNFLIIFYALLFSPERSEAVAAQVAQAPANTRLARRIQGHEDGPCPLCFSLESSAKLDSIRLIIAIRRIKTREIETETQEYAQGNVAPNVHYVLQKKMPDHHNYTTIQRPMLSVPF
ncbi:hypothetical protein EVAR_61862_1 [Eumeta japonica]|uniref:Uncharacterized protein n=1 Tax=Eumeta variegata TaxID=151549 RepID=A0A4C1ZDI4_EUMVA|nr:hypothetical protein EVAR_61862_1 [Eumeta japonica]